MATTWRVQEKTVSMPADAWETESTYSTEREAIRACAGLRKREPLNDVGEEMEYRVVEVQS